MRKNPYFYIALEKNERVLYNTTLDFNDFLIFLRR